MRVLKRSGSFEDVSFDKIIERLQKLSEDYENAESFYLYITENYPDFFQGYAGYLLATSKQSKFDEAITLLNKLVELEYDKDAIIEYLEEDDETGINVLEDLVKSDAYKTWKG